MTLIWRPGFQFDADASTYIEAVEVADGQALETGVRYAINNFVIGCKQDGTWNAIKASCILAGARTLAGALVPLVGTAPTNYNFVAGDYNRETGLKGDGSTKYLDSNRNNNADPQNSTHAYAHVSTADTRFATGASMAYFGASNTGFTSRVGIGPYINQLYLSNRSGAAPSGAGNATGGCGCSRSDSTGYSIRIQGANASRTVSSVAPDSTMIAIFATRNPAGVDAWTNARLSFYSIGESLDLAALDGRVTDLMTAIGVAIP